MLSFKPLSQTDSALLQRLAEKIWRDAYADILSNEQIQYMLSIMYDTHVLEKEIIDTNYIWEFIIYSESVVGYLSCKREAKKLFLSKLYLDSLAQGKGIGQAALEHIKKIAENESFESIYLTVNKVNFKAIKAYERFGYKNVESRIINIGNGFVMDDYVYLYSLI